MTCYDLIKKDKPSEAVSFQLSIHRYSKVAVVMLRRYLLIGVFIGTIVIVAVW